MTVEGALAAFAEFCLGGSDERVDVVEAHGQIGTLDRWWNRKTVHLLHIENPGGLGEQALAAVLVFARLVGFGVTLCATLFALRMPTRIRARNPLAIVCGARRYVASAATTTLWRGEINILRHISPVW